MCYKDIASKLLGVTVDARAPSSAPTSGRVSATSRRVGAEQTRSRSRALARPPTATPVSRAVKRESARRARSSLRAATTREDDQRRALWRRPSSRPRNCNGIENSLRRLVRSSRATTMTHTETPTAPSLPCADDARFHHRHHPAPRAVRRAQVQRAAARQAASDLTRLKIVEVSSHPDARAAAVRIAPFAECVAVWGRWSSCVPLCAIVSPISSAHPHVRAHRRGWNSRA